MQSNIGRHDLNQKLDKTLLGQLLFYDKAVCVQTTTLPPTGESAHLDGDEYAIVHMALHIT